MRMRNYISAAFFAGLAILVVQACYDNGNAPTDPGSKNDMVSFAGDIRDTLIVRCAKPECHGSTSPQGGFNMGGVSWSEIRNGTGNHGPVVIAGDAAASNLFLKLTSNPPFGFRMPQDGPPFLSIESQTAIRDWIDQGALDN